VKQFTQKLLNNLLCQLALTTPPLQLRRVDQQHFQPAPPVLPSERAKETGRLVNAMKLKATL